jgi:hypothetical protein
VPAVGPPGRGRPLPGAVNGESLPQLITDHHAIGIMDALVLAPIGALIVVGDRRHLLAWLLLVDGLVLGALNVAEQYAPLALGLTSRQLSLPGGELASWVASWAFVPGIVIGVVFLVLLFPDGRLPSPRWWPLGLAGPRRRPSRRSCWPSAPGRCAGRGWSPRRVKSRTWCGPCSGSPSR